MSAEERICAPSVEDNSSLLRQVRRVLRRTGYPPLHQIDCRVENGVVELSGDVPSFYCKQIAQTAVLALKRVRRVENCLRVC